MASLLQLAFERFDRANADDPFSEVVDGKTRPSALVYAERMTDRLDRFAPDSPEPLRLAARCQHIRRWTTPRTDFRAGRAGYRQWRKTLAEYHARVAAEILRGVGYEEPTIATVEGLLRKEKLKSDKDVQTLEDVACLVFLEHYLEGFATEHDAEKLVGILRKTWRKMSSRAHEAAFTIDLPTELKALVRQAIEV